MRILDGPKLEIIIFKFPVCITGRRVEQGSLDNSVFNFIFRKTLNIWKKILNFRAGAKLERIIIIIIIVDSTLSYH